jgi:aminoglycoside phosphotransferase (APT) family kinase protein
MNFDIEDFAALRSYLKQRGHASREETVSLEKLAGGVSNRTVRIAWPDGRSWVLKQSLPKLRVQADWFSDPERIRVEAGALQWLNAVTPPGTTPAFIFEDAANHLLAMQAVPEPHENWKALLLSGHLASGHFQQSARLLATIHSRSSEATPELRSRFADTTHFETLRLQPYYMYSAQQVPDAAGFLQELAADALRHKVCLVHGDFSPKNMLIHDGKLVLLDHEVMHFGEPAFDLGFIFTHFLSKAHHLPESRARLGNAAALFWGTYQEGTAQLSWSNSLEPRAVQHTLACLLARVAGKSPLEYFSAAERDRQRRIVLELMTKPPASMYQLIAEFTRAIDTYA